MFLDAIYQLRRGWRLQWEPAQNCHVVLYPEGMVKLSHSAGAVLEQINGDASVRDIIAALRERFPDADPEALGHDVADFMAEAQANGWLELKETSR